METVPHSDSTSHHASPTTVPGTCAQCSLRINTWQEACHAMGYLYHNSCFVCCFCRETQYGELDTETKPVSDSNLFEAGSIDVGVFFTSQSLSPTNVNSNFERMLRGKTFYRDQDNIFCEDDYLHSGFRESAEKCATCGNIILETILQAAGKSYHPGCFRCSVCTIPLDGQPFTIGRQGRIFCVTDYYLVHSPLCAACGLAILPDESGDLTRVVALEKEFHPNCYKCEDCGKLLDDEPSSRCFPLSEPQSSTPTSDKPSKTDKAGRQHLLCLSCHIRRIGAIPATTSNQVDGAGGHPTQSSLGVDRGGHRQASSPSSSSTTYSGGRISISPRPSSNNGSPYQSSPRDQKWYRQR